MRIARENRVRWILQIAFLTEEAAVPSIANSKAPKALDGHVLSHFRDIRLVRNLGRRAGLPVRVFDEPFRHSERTGYLTRARDAIRKQRTEETGIVLLDPDTGLSERPRQEHVSPEEVRGVWCELHPGDWLLLYQHADRTRSWKPRHRDEFASAVQGVPVDTLWSPDGAKDVALFAAEKPGANGRGTPRHTGRRA